VELVAVVEDVPQAYEDVPTALTGVVLELAPQV